MKKMVFDTMDANDIYGEIECFLVKKRNSLYLNYNLPLDITQQI